MTSSSKDPPPQQTRRQLALSFISNKRHLQLHLLGYRNTTHCFYSGTFDGLQIVLPRAFSVIWSFVYCHLFGICTTFLKECTRTKGPVWHHCTVQYISGGLFIPLVHQGAVTVIPTRLDYTDNNERQWTFGPNVQGIPLFSGFLFKCVIIVVTFRYRKKILFCYFWKAPRNFRDYIHLVLKSSWFEAVK